MIYVSFLYLCVFFYRVSAHDSFIYSVLYVCLSICPPLEITEQSPSLALKKVLLYELNTQNNTKKKKKERKKNEKRVQQKICLGKVRTELFVASG